MLCIPQYLGGTKSSSYPVLLAERQAGIEAGRLSLLPLWGDSNRSLRSCSKTFLRIDTRIKLKFRAEEHKAMIFPPSSVH